jgi:hypothetical protein
MQEQGQVRKAKGGAEKYCLYMAKNSRLVLREGGKEKKGKEKLF